MDDNTTEDTTPTGQAPPIDDRAVSVAPSALAQEPHTGEQLDVALAQVFALEAEAAQLRRQVRAGEEAARVLRQRVAYLEATTAADVAPVLGLKVEPEDYQCSNCGAGYSEEQAMELNVEELDELVIRCTCGGALCRTHPRSLTETSTR